jgi:NADH dehydrogenase FAD-containing subunit
VSRAGRAVAVSGRRGHVVLVGAGHAHLEVLRRADDLRAAGVQLSVIAPGTFRYSGLASPVAAGLVAESEGTIDVGALAARHGVAHHDGLVDAIDLPGCRVRADDGSWYPYTAVSFNLGSVSRTGPPAVVGEVTVTKPLTGLARLRTRLAELAGAHRPPRVAVVGGGASGVELAATIAVRLGRQAEVSLYGRGSRLLVGAPGRAAHLAATALGERGVRLHLGVPVDVVGPDHVEVDGRRRAVDLTVLATGLVAPPVLAELGLGDARGVPTLATLQHPDHPEVFAVGDGAHFLPRPLPNLGVYGVRAAPVLVAGLRAFHTAGRQPVFRPQQRSLQVLELGAGEALGIRDPLAWRGRSALRLKRRIDRRWLERYR